MKTTEKNCYISMVEKTSNERDALIVLHKDWQWYFGRFKDVDQLNFLADLLGFTYELFDERDTPTNGIYKAFKMSHNLKDDYTGYFYKLSELPKGVKPFKAVSNGSIVTCYFLNDGKTIHIFRPNPNAKEVYKPLEINEHISHVKIYGSY